MSNALKRSSNREKKPNHKDDLGYVESKAKCKDHKLLEVAKRCDKVIQKLKKHPFSEKYFQPIIEIPNLAEVERKVKLYQYNTIHLFAVDVRNVWKYYYVNASSNPDLYQKTVEMTQYFEEIFSEIEEIPFETPYLENLNKKIKSIEDHLQMRGIKNNPSTSNMFTGTNKTSKAPIPLQEKPMTIIEKKALGDKIRMLNQDQMKGIINILSDQCSLENNSRYFEFNIDTLPTKKLRDLEKYVKRCLKNTSNSSKNVTPILAKSELSKNEVKSLSSNNLINNISNNNNNSTNGPNNNVNAEQEKPTSIKQPHSMINSNTNQNNKLSNTINNQGKLQNIEDRSLDSLSSSDDDSGSLSSLNFKKEN